MSGKKKRDVVVAPELEESEDRADSLVEFRKANDSIGLKVVEGNLSLLSRKLYNVFISNAQKQARPGVNAPIDDPSAESYFWMPMQEVIKDTRYNSRDYDTLKQHANELQNIKVEAESTKMWTSERLLSGVKIYNSKGLKSKGGDVYLGYAFPPEVLQTVLKPSVYTRFSLYYQTQLRTGSSLALYEICRRIATSPSHVTTREPWEQWFYTITGTPTTDKNLPEYKYFKRDHLVKSITEINALTDIDVELMEFKEGRKVAKLQFKVYPKAQQSLEIAAMPIINMEVVERIMALGISKEDATEIYTQYEENVILAHLDLVASRQKNAGLTPLDSVAAYFKTAIKRGFANGKAVEKPQEAKPAAPKKKKNLRERFMAARAKDALDHYNKLVAAEQKKLLTTFSKQADSSLKPFLKKGLEMALVRSAFADWLGTYLWGEPTDSQILDFLESEGD